jgi:hypothetical protein
MPSKIVRDRIQSILETLKAAHAGGADVSTPTMGRDRELFINMVLSNIISVPFRLGTGDIVDRNDKKSRQADIVIEYANTLSFPSIYPHSARLYLAESVCAVVEIKSTLSTQWPHIKDAAAALHELDREVGEIASVGPPPPSKIPLFVVGYTGWVEAKTALDNLEKINAHGHVLVSGILQIDPCFYVGAKPFSDHSFIGPEGLFGFLLSIEQLTSSVISTKPPFSGYIR